MSEPIPAPDSPPPLAVGTGLKRNVAAGIACLLSLVSGIVFLVLEPKDKFVRFWALQSVIWGVAAIVIAGVVAVATPVLGWLPLIGTLLSVILTLVFWIFKLAWVVVYFICVIKAFSDETWEIPWVGKFARRFLAGADSGEQPPA